MRKIYTLILCLLLAQVSIFGQIRILTLGDSTTADYDEDVNSGESEQRGWAQMLPLFLNEKATLTNAAKNGRSTKSFYFEYWGELSKSLQKGDYVIIQFGHNDEKDNGADTDENDITQRGTAPWSQYQKYLRKYVEETRSKGAIPILVTPVVRCMFSGDKLAPKGRHSLSQFCNGNDSILNYPLAMKAVAREMNVPLIDMTTSTQKLVESYGKQKASEIIYVNTDKTHLKAKGGVLYSHLFVGEMKSNNILNEVFKTPEQVVLSPTQYDFGKQALDHSLVKITSLLGTDMDVNKYPLKLTVDGPFEIALGKNELYSQEILIDNKDANFTHHVYIRFTPKNKNVVKSKLKVVSKGKILGGVTLKGEGVELTGKATSLLEWSPSASTKVVKGKVVSKVASNIEGLSITDTGNIQPTSSSWPAREIDMDSHRYIGFQIKASDKDLYVSKLSFDLSAKDDDNLYFTALSSLDRWFKQQTSYEVMAKMGEFKTYSFDKLIKIPAGEVFYFRIYPWCKSNKEEKGRGFSLQNIKVIGLEAD